MKDNIIQNPPKYTYVEPAIETNYEEFHKVIKSRRSVRAYLPEAIPDEIVKACIRDALLAPSSSNLQPWEFYWVKTPDKKQKLVEYCMGQPAASTAPTLIVVVSRTQQWRTNRKLILDFLNKNPQTPKAQLHYYEKLIPMANGYTNPLISWVKKLGVCISGLLQVTPRVPTSQADLLTWAHKSTALACQNLMLSFRAQGYDTCPMEGMDKVRIKKLLNLPSDADVCMVISAGKRAPLGVYWPTMRLDESLFIHEV